VTDQHWNARVRSAVEPPLSASGFELVDVERQGTVVRVTVDLLVGPGDQVDRAGGLDLDGVTEATRVVNEILDREDLMGEKTTLEVSSPGVERPLRTPEHFRRFVGTEVAVKAKAGTEGERRVTGVLETADDEGVVVAGRRLAYTDIERARTVFVWPSQPSSGRAAGKRTQKKMGRAS
jgi:ribosome maturation factor RimP